MRFFQARALHRVLTSGSEEDRVWALQQLGELGTRRSLELVVSQLLDRSIAVRLAAARVLRKSGWQPNDPEEKAWFLVADRRWEEAATLGAVSVPALYALLKDSDQEVRRHGARALELTGSPRASDFLAASLRARDHTLETRLAIVRALAGGGGRKSLETLAGLLDDENYAEIAEEALRAGGEVAVQPLAHLLTGGSPPQRSRAATLLGEIGGDEAQSALITALRAGDPEARAGAARGLRHFRNAPVKTELLRVLRTRENPHALRLAAVESLASWGEEAVPFLRDHLQSETGAAERRRLIRALATTKSGAAAGVLVGTYAGASPEEKGALREALIALGEPAVAALVELLARGDDLVALCALLTRSSWRPQGEARFLYWLGTGEWERCLTAEAIPAIALALRHNPLDPRIVSTVAAAAQRLADPSMTRELVHWLDGYGRREELEGAVREVLRALRREEDDEELVG